MPPSAGSRTLAGMPSPAIKILSKAMIHTFFRKVELDGSERLPLTGPVITVANHANGLVDGLLLMSLLPRWPRFLGKATLFNTPLKPFLNMAGVIPVFRAKDAKAGDADRVAQNDATFAACRRLLVEGQVVSIFPEGISHDLNSLQPLRTGAARIALGAAFDDGASGVQIVPIGLAYDAKATFRSHAIVTIGDPIAVGQWADAFAADPRAAARSCTDAITAGLLAVSPDDATITQPTAVTRRLRFSTAVRAAKDVTPRPALLLAAPIALIGATIHAIPYQVMKRAATMPRSESIKSTVKLLGCTVLFVAEWLGLSAWVWRKRGALPAALTLVACPTTGYVAVRFAETLRDSAPPSLTQARR